MKTTIVKTGLSALLALGMACGSFAIAAPAHATNPPSINQVKEAYS